MAWLTSHTPFSPISLNTLESLYKCPEIKILIAKAFGIDAGFIILDLEGPNNCYGSIAGLGILPKFQRKGIGINLGLEAWNNFKQKGIKELRCEVYLKNKRSYAFIKAMGFKKFGLKINTLENSQQAIELEH